MLSSGSVDQKNTYVFQVVPSGVKESIAKTLSYWSTGNGDDTMVTLWNPADEAQDFLFTLFYAGGQYRYPIHLEPRATHMFNISEILHMAAPDDQGNVVPAGVHEGSAVLSGSQGEAEHILVAMDAGTYNVQKATCQIYCWTCQGAVNSWVTDDPFAVAVSGTHQLTFTAQNHNGRQYNDTVSASWSSTNTSVATVGTNTGLVSGVAVGSLTVAAIDDFYPVYDTGCVGGGLAPPTCPDLTGIGGGGTGNVTPKILLGGSSGTDITNSTQNVVVGQQVVLYGSYNLPSGYTFTGLSWSIPGTGSTPPTAISNFTWVADFSSGGPVPLTSAQLGQQTVTYYFITPASSQAVTFTLNYNDSSGTAQKATAQATFNIAGPTNVQIQYIEQGTPQFLNNGTTSAFLELGDPTGNNTSGIQWSASATSPSQAAGTYRWAQIIANSSYTYTVGTTTTPCADKPGLDNQIPLSITTGTFTDSPDQPLPSAASEFTWSWDATTSFMWNPGINNSSIWVPIAQREWKFYADVTQNLSTNIWTVQSDSSKFVGAPQVGYYPIQWNVVQKNGKSACP